MASMARRATHPLSLGAVIRGGDRIQGTKRSSLGSLNMPRSMNRSHTELRRLFGKTWRVLIIESRFYGDGVLGNVAVRPRGGHCVLPNANERPHSVR